MANETGTEIHGNIIKDEKADCGCLESPRALLIQSHVVSGYVGNKSAVFPMQVRSDDDDV